jgi:hypothetical protein
MIGRRFRSTARWCGVAVVCLGLISACGNDQSKTENSRLASSMFKELVGSMKRNKTDAPKVDAEALSAKALATIPGPLLLISFEKTGGAAVVGLFGENGSKRTFALANQQTLTLRNGLLEATRGLGNDLMSAETEGVGALIRSRRAGQAQRIQRYLDGEWVERPLILTCTVQPGEARSFTFAGLNYSGTQVLERCSGGGASADNVYLVSSDGRILLSRQWIGPEIGNVNLQTIRP